MLVAEVVAEGFRRLKFVLDGGKGREGRFLGLGSEVCWV